MLSLHLVILNSIFSRHILLLFLLLLSSPYFLMLSHLKAQSSDQHQEIEASPHFRQKKALPSEAGIEE